MVGDWAIHLRKSPREKETKRVNLKLEQEDLKERQVIGRVDNNGSSKKRRGNHSGRKGEARKLKTQGRKGEKRSLFYQDGGRAKQHPNGPSARDGKNKNSLRKKDSRQREWRGRTRKGGATEKIVPL